MHSFNFQHLGGQCRRTATLRPARAAQKEPITETNPTLEAQVRGLSGSGHVLCKPGDLSALAYEHTPLYTQHAIHVHTHSFLPRNIC